MVVVVVAKKECVGRGVVAVAKVWVEREGGGLAEEKKKQCRSGSSEGVEAKRKK